MCKKTKIVEYRQCDFCTDTYQDCYRHCLGCGKDVCYECMKRVGVEYPHSFWCTGTGDGFYCHDCDASDNSALHNAYQTIRSLRLEANGYHENFKARAEAVENRIKKLLEKNND